MSLSSKPRAFILFAALATACMMFAVVFAGHAKAGQPAGNTYSTAFEEGDFNPGSPNEQDGWVSTGNFDHEIEDISANEDAPVDFEDQSLRISNGVTSGSFGDQTFSAEVDEAGQANAQSDIQSSDDRQSRFESSFEFTSATPNDAQPGLSLGVSPDRGDGARMGLIRLEDLESGLQVTFFDYQAGEEEGCNGEFVDTVIADGLDRSGVYTVELVMDFNDERTDDVVRITVKDGSGQVVGFHTGTSWEDFFIDCQSETFSNGPPTVDSLLFRTAGPAAPDTADEGFLIDNLDLETSETPGPAACTIVGTENDDNLVGTDGDDVICGLGGGDTIFGGDGDDAILGGDGNDSMNGQGGDDTIFGQNGNDLLIGADGNDSMNGGTGPDRLFGQNGNDLAIGGDGNDRLDGGGGADRLFGQGGADSLFGGDGNDRLSGGDGNDSMNGQGGADQIFGQGGADLLIGGAGNDQLYGQSGNDRLNTRDNVRGNDLANGGAGRDACAADPGDREVNCER